MELRKGVFPVWVIWLICLAALIVCRNAVTEAILKGLDQCMRVVIPSLFPFFLVVNLLLGTEFPDLLAKKFGRWMERLFHLPAVGSVAMILSLLGGYPIGAKTAAELCQQQRLDRACAQRLLACCNNTGPAIFFGLIGGTLYPDIRLPLIMYLIHILSCLMTGVLLRPDRPPRPSPLPAASHRKGSVTQAIRSAFSSCVGISVFVVAFRIVIELTGRFIQALCPALAATPAAGAILAGLLDLPNGISALQTVKPLPLQFFLCNAFVGWAGLCIHLQTRAVTEPAGLKLSWHWIGKLTQCVCAMILSIPVCCYLSGASAPVLLWVPAIAVIFIFLKTKVEISGISRYNRYKVG